MTRLDITLNGHSTKKRFTAIQPRAQTGRCGVPSPSFHQWMGMTHKIAAAQQQIWAGVPFHSSQQVPSKIKPVQDARKNLATTSFATSIAPIAAFDDGARVKRRKTYTASALAALVIAFLALLFFRRPGNTTNSPALSVARLPAALAKPAPTTASRSIYSGELPLQLGPALIAKAFKPLAEAKRVRVTAFAGGSPRYTMVTISTYWNHPTRGPLYRVETITLAPDGKPISCEISIFNESGFWSSLKGKGIDDVAFKVEGPAAATGTMSWRDGYVSKTHVLPSDLAHDKMGIAQENRDGRPVLRITKERDIVHTHDEYVIDATSGAIVSALHVPQKPRFGPATQLEEFELDPPLNEHDFDTAKDAIIIPTNNVLAETRRLLEDLGNEKPTEPIY